jgi:hypothetical protein
MARSNALPTLLPGTAFTPAGVHAMRLLQFPSPFGRGGHALEDVWSVHLEVERGAPFCANPRCALHVRLLDAQVQGGGNWISLPDGRIFGRNRFGAALLCDACGTQRGPVRIDACVVTN